MEKRKPRRIKEVANVKELLKEAVENYGNEDVFQIKLSPVTQKKDIQYRTVTYQTLWDEVMAYGTKLYDLGLKEKRVAILGRNQYGWVVAHLANLLGGMVSIPLDKDLQDEELESSLVRSKAEVFVFDAKYMDKVQKIQQEKKTQVKTFICMTPLEGYIDLPSLIEQGKELVAKGKTEFLDYEPDGKNMSILLFTSGTTSKSKAVMLSQYGIVTNIYDMLLVENFYEGDVNIAFLPFHHIFGSTCMLVMLAAGVKTVFPDGLRYIQTNLKEYGVSVFVGVPV